MRAESWAQAVDDEMRANGYTRIVAFLPSNRLKVVWKKGFLIGAAVGNVEEFSHLLVRAAIAAYEEENGQPLLRSDS